MTITIVQILNLVILVVLVFALAMTLCVNASPPCAGKRSGRRRNSLLCGRAECAHKAADVSVASLAEWKAPTDFLLETPGRELLRTVPEIGEWRGYTVALPGTR